MADNVTANAGAGGAVFATDDIGGVHYPITKITIGALNSQTLLSGGNGTTDAGTIRVTVSSDSTGVLSVDDNGGSLTVDASSFDIRALTNADVVTAELSATDNAVLDNIDTNTTDLPNVIGTDGSTGPTKAISIGGTDGSGNLQEITTDTDGHLQVDLVTTGSVVDANNSSTANLGNGGVFTGSPVTDVSGYAAVCINIYSDQDSASDGMTFQFCSNSSFGADTDTYTFTMTGGESRRFQFPVTAQYFRVQYTNGTTPTGDLDIQTILHPTSPGYTSIHRIEDNVSTDRSAEVVKAALIAQINGSGDFIPIQATASGVLKVGGSVEVDTWSAGTLTVDLGSNNDVQGAVAEGAAVSGNPFLIAGDDGTNVKHVAVAADGAIHVDDGGNSITVDATSLDIRALTNTDTVTAELSATDNAVLDDIAARTSDPTVFVDDAGFTVATSKGQVVMGVNTTDTVDAGDAGALSIDSSRHLQVDIAADSVGIGGGTQYTEDDAAAANPVGNAVILVRDDTPGALVSTDGDNVAQRGTNYGAAFCQIVDSSGNLIDSFGGGTQYAVDDALGATPTGTLALGIRDNELSSLTPAEGDAVGLRVDTNGALWTVVNGTVAAAQSGTWNITNISGTISLPTGAATAANQSTHTTALQLIDNMIVAHDAAITGATGLAAIGLNARSTSPTAVQDGDAVRALATLLGKVVTYPYAIPANTWQYAAASGGIVNTTGVTAKAAAGAGIRNYITSVEVINGHATVSTDVQIRDGASGTVLWRGFAQAAGGGCSAKFDPPLRGTANTLVEVACGTTGTATYFNLQGFVAAE